MFCPKCGVKVDDSQRFCKRCGAKVNRLRKDGVNVATANDGNEGSQAKKASSETTATPVAHASAESTSKEADQSTPKLAAGVTCRQPVKPVSKKTAANVPSANKSHEVGLATDEKVPSSKSEDSEKANAATQGAGAALQMENAKSSKLDTSSSNDSRSGETADKHVRQAAERKSATRDGSAARKLAFPKRRRNAVIAIASGSLAAAVLAVTMFLTAGPAKPFDVETPTVCTKATHVSPSDETGKVLNSYKVSLIDRKTGKEVSSRQLKKSDGFALGDFEDENGQPISDGDYMLRYEDMESGNIYDGRYIDVRDGDSAAVASTTGITGSSDESLYSDKKEIERLNQELQAFSIREQQMKDEQAALYAENEGLKAELGIATQKNGEYEAVIEAGAAELESKQKTIDEQDEKLKKAESEISSLKDEVEEKQKQIDSLKDELSNSSSEREDEELAKKQEEIESLKAEIGKKQGEIDELKKRVEELEARPQGNAGGNAVDGESDDDELDHEDTELDDEDGGDGEDEE